MLDRLKENPKNPRTLSKEAFERLKNKVKSFPEMLEKRPIVYDENFIVLGGNQRLRVLKELVKEGFEVKDSYFMSAEGWSEEQKRQFVITDNVSDGEWDYEILGNEWDDLPLNDWGVDTFNITLDEIDDIDIDEEREAVLMVNPPESPKLKERMAFFCKNIDQYNKIINFFKDGMVDLNVDKLERMIDEVI